MPVLPAWASDDSCGIPGYLSDPEGPNRATTHYHPSVFIVVYVRDSGITPSRAHVTKLITPPANLGIHTLHSPQSENWIYRQIHSHDGGGVLHVEPKPGHVIRLCQLFNLWLSAVGTSLPFSDFDRHKRVSIILGQEQKNDWTFDEFLMISLNNDRQIIILVEEGQIM